MNYNFTITSGNSTSSIKAQSPFDAAKFIAARLGVSHDSIKYMDNRVYKIGDFDIEICLAV